MLAKSLRRRAAAVMVDFGVRGYSVRVGRCSGAWAHCDYTAREIVLDRALMKTDWVFANQIILHEVAHALQGGGHSREWMRTARAMGYRLGVQVPYDTRYGRRDWVAVCRTGQHSAIRRERGHDGKLCQPCYDSGAGDVEVFYERL